MQIGNRIIYDQDGDIVTDLGEMQGDVLPRKDVSSLNFIDLEFGKIDYSKYKITRIDIDTKKPILEEIAKVETEAERFQREKEELENQLLLATDSQVGGIL